MTRSSSGGYSDGWGGEASSGGGEPSRDKQILVFRATKEPVNSYEQLEDKLFALGWDKYRGGLEPEHALDTEMRQYFHSRPGDYFISLPLDFQKLRVIHLYHIVVQSRTAFEIQEIPKGKL